MSLDLPTPLAGTSRGLIGDFRRFRIGILVVENDPIPELEINRQAPPGVSVHAARFKLPREMGKEFTGEGSDTRLVGPHLLDALTVLDRIGVDAVGLCFTSSSIFSPKTFDDAFIASALAVNPTWLVSTAARSIVRTMNRAAAENPHVVVPPWFTLPTIEALRAYLSMHGIAVAGHHYHELDAAWDEFPRQDRFDMGAKWAVEPRELAVDLHARDLGSADSILIPGSGFPSLDVLHARPLTLPLPTFTANAALLKELLHQGATIKNQDEA